MENFRKILREGEICYCCYVGCKEGLGEVELGIFAEGVEDFSEIESYRLAVGQGKS